jgi:hypothetical protein
MAIRESSAANSLAAYAKEMLNHVAWTAAAGLTHRAADQVQQRRQTGVAA